MAQFSLSENIIGELSSNVDAYIRIVSSGRIPQVNLNTIKSLFVLKAVDELRLNYGLRTTLAKKHAIVLVDAIVKYRIGLVQY